MIDDLLLMVAGLLAGVIVSEMRWNRKAGRLLVENEVLRDSLAQAGHIETRNTALIRAKIGMDPWAPGRITPRGPLPTPGQMSADNRTNVRKAPPPPDPDLRDGEGAK